MYLIIDWAGNKIYPDKTFKTFEEAWEFIYETFPEEDWEELEVYRSESNE